MGTNFSKTLLVTFVLLASSFGPLNFHVPSAHAEEAYGSITIGTCWNGSYARIYGDIIAYMDVDPHVNLTYYSISAGGVPIDTGINDCLYPAVYEDLIVFPIFGEAEIGFYNISTATLTTVAHPIGDTFNLMDVVRWALTWPSRAISIYGNIVAFHDTSGLWCYNIATDNFTQIDGGGTGVSVYGDAVAFSQEGIIKYYDTTTGVITNTTLAGTCPSVYEDIIAFQFDSVIMYYDMTSETATNTGQAGEGPSIYLNTIAYSSSDIIMTYNVVTGNVTNTGEVGNAPSVGYKGIAFVTPAMPNWLVKFLPIPHVITQLGLVLDGSGSISPSDFTIIKNGVAEAIRNNITHDGTVELTVVQFSSSPNARVEVGPITVDATNYESIAIAIENLVQIDGGTAMADGLYLTWHTMKNSPAFASAVNQFINVATDGFPNVVLQAIPSPTGNAADDVTWVRDHAATQRLDELDAEGIGVTNSSLEWMRDGLVYPQPGTIAPPYTPGWVNWVQNATEFANAVGQKIPTVLYNPKAIFSESAHDAIVNQTIIFNASASYDPDGSIVSYFWDFGDGTNASVIVVGHAYSDNGTFTVTLTVTDNDDRIGIATATKVVTIPRDVAIIGVVPSSTSVDLGQSVTINVTVQNQGILSETFNVDVFLSVYANTTFLANQTVISLAPAATRTLTFSWNTTGFMTGPYKITAVASTVPTETDTADNANASCGMVEVQTGNMRILSVFNCPAYSTLLSFTINNTRSVSPWSGALDEGTYVITMPSTITDNSVIYAFKNWEDNTTDPVRTINLTDDMNIIAYYEPAVQPRPLIYVSPIVTTADPNSDFTVNVNIANVTNLHSWEFKIYYDTRFMDAIDAAEGPFLETVGTTAFQKIELSDAYNATHGLVWLNCTLLTQGANGNGTLATIAFTATAHGNSILNLGEIELIDDNLDPIIYVSLPGVGLVRVKMLADVNNDGVVNIVDVVFVGRSFDAKKGEAPNPPIHFGYNPHADIKPSYDVINIIDIVAVAIHFDQEVC